MSRIEDSYIKDYILKLFENVYSNDLEKLKAIYYGLVDILDSIQFNLETEEDTENYKQLSEALDIIYSVIKKEEQKEHND